MHRTPHSIRFGQIVKSLRLDLTDLETGLPWTQGKLGEVSGLGRTTIGKIERGDQAKLDGAVLMPLGKALNLHTLMQRELNEAAIDRSGEWPVQRREQAANKVIRHVWSILGRMYQPAYVIDPVGNLIGLNAPMMRFHHITVEHLEAAKQTSSGANIIGEFFRQNSVLRRAMGRQHEAIARFYMQQFLFTSLPIRYADRFQTLLPALMRLPGFRPLYREQREAPDDFSSQLCSFAYEHAFHGPVSYSVSNTSARTPFGYLIYATFAPLDGATREAFRLSAQAGLAAHQVEPWPTLSFCIDLPQHSMKNQCLPTGD